MVLPTSGLITLSQVQAEFGGAAPTSISEYYRGGGLVPAWSGTNGVPSSGTISLSNFYGARPYPTQTVFKVTGSFNTNLSSVPKFAALVGARFSAGTISISTPSTSVAGCSTVVYRQNTNRDDGHAAGIWLANLGTATNVTFNLADANIWMVVILNNVTSLGTVAATFTDSAAALNLATSSQGFALAATVNNFGGVGPTITNCNDNYTNSDTVTVGLDSVTTGSTTSYAGSGTSIQLNLAASFAY